MTEAATPISSAPDYAPMLADLQASFESEKTMSLQWRAAQLEALERMMVEREQEFIDALAKESVVFEQAYAPAPWTPPSVASLITSRHHRYMVTSTSTSPTIITTQVMSCMNRTAPIR